MARDYGNSAYEQNFGEKQARLNYSRQNFWFTLAFVCFASYFFIKLFIYDEGRSSLDVFFNFPNTSDWHLYLYELLFTLLIYGWWHGIPERLGNLFPDEKWQKTLVAGRRKSLQDFFFQKTIKNDNIPKAEAFRFLESKKLTIDRLFNFNPVTHKETKGGTDRIILLFRDHRRERLVKLTKSFDSQKKERAKKALVAYDEEYRNQGIPAPDQEKLYDELMRMVEGVLQGYKIDVDGRTVGEIKKKNLSTPIKISKISKSGRVIIKGVDEDITVFDKENVVFSLRMVIETTRIVSILFTEYVTMLSNMQSTIAKRYSKYLQDEATMQKMLDIFQFVFFRRLMLNYGSLPSGWFVIRIDDYDLRAILSAIDRDMIPTITSANDGSSSVFSSDVFCSMFLYSYWSFLRNPRIAPVMESVDWCFNTIKDVNEIKVREFAQKQARILMDQEEEKIKRQEKEDQDEREDA